MKRWTGCGILVAIGLLGLGGLAWGVSAYNGLVRRDVRVAAAWGDVENAYQRRMDLIPNLVETVKGAAAVEKPTLEAVVEARATATQIVLTPEILNDPERFDAFRKAQSELSGALSRLLETVEAYPELETAGDFIELQSRLKGTENRISNERRRLDEAVRDYNVAVRSFPGSLIASLFHFGPKAFFESDSGADKAPGVSF